MYSPVFSAQLTSIALSLIVLHNKEVSPKLRPKLENLQSSDSKSLGSNDLHKEAGVNSPFNRNFPRLKVIDFMHKCSPHFNATNYTLMYSKPFWTLHNVVSLFSRKPYCNI